MYFNQFDRHPASFHSACMFVNGRRRPITACNFRRHVVQFSNMFENIFSWPTFVGRQKMADFSATHERFLLPDTATSTLIVPSTRRVTLGDRAFLVAAADAWNGLPSSIRAASSLQLFCRELKTALFSLSFDTQD